MPTWHSTNGSKRNSENKEKTKDTKKRSPKCWRPFLVYKQSKRFGLIKTILMIYFVFKTSFLAFIFSPANIYPSSFWLLCFIPTFITKTPTIHYQDAHYSLSEQGTSPYLSLAINYHIKIKRFFLSHLTLLFSTQSRIRERRFMIHLKYFLQITPPTTRISSFEQGTSPPIW